MSLSTNGTGWEQAVADLRAALLGLPLDGLRVASISTHGSFIMYSPPDLADDDPDVSAYARHPETWSEFVAQPQGIQILTNDHLQQASDLTDWNTTRLDARHVLVEARDLFYWYGAHRAYSPLPHRSPEWTKAREDFGDMMLSWSRATTLGIATPPRESF